MVISPHIRFDVRISARLWRKWLKANPQFIQVGRAHDPDQTEAAAILESLLATILTSDLLKVHRTPLTDTSTALMLAVGHVEVTEEGLVKDQDPEES